VEPGNKGAAVAVVRGRVARGEGEGAAFTQLAWARAAFVRLLGIDPFPGTLNLAPEDAAAWAALRARPGIAIPPPDATFCAARAWKVRVAGRIDAAIVVPEVAGYPDDKIEIIAAVSLRDALGLVDGDVVAVEVVA
jgi:CTP-dependent riboflavin kinase